MKTKMEKKRKRETEMKPRSSLKSTLSLDELPDAILELIFSKLSFSILYFTCRHVCRSWMNLISISISISTPNLPFFALTTPHDLRCIDFDSKYSLGQMIRSSALSLSLHPNYSDHYSIQILNSCRGLLCCSILDRRDNTTRICVLNPTTKEYIQVPSSHDKIGKKYYYGFGFSPKTKQFKIVRHSVGWGRYRTAVETWAFGTIRRPKWILVPGFHFLSLQTHGAYFDGALYWVAGFRYRPDLYNDKFLYRFDLEDNKLNFFTLPELGIEQDCPCHTFFFQVLNDFFYLTLYTERQSGEYQVWKMEEDRSSWIKVFVVPELELSGARRDNRSFRLQLIKVCEDGKIMCLCDGLDLLLYDPVTRMTQILTEQALETKQHLEFLSSQWEVTFVVRKKGKITRVATWFLPPVDRRPVGDRIYRVFDHQLPAALRKLPFDRHLSLKNVQKVVSEADGYQPHLIAPEQGYRRLIDGSISYFKGPAQASVDAVHFVLKGLVRKCIAETKVQM